MTHFSLFMDNAHVKKKEDKSRCSSCFLRKITYVVKSSVVDFFFIFIFYKAVMSVINNLANNLLNSRTGKNLNRTEVEQNFTLNEVSNMDLHEIF